MLTKFEETVCKFTNLAHRMNNALNQTQVAAESSKEKFTTLININVINKSVYSNKQTLSTNIHSHTMT